MTKSLHSCYGAVIFCLLCAFVTLLYQSSSGGMRLKNTIRSVRPSDIKSGLSEDVFYIIPSDDDSRHAETSTNKQITGQQFILDETTKRHTYPYQLVSGAPGSGNSWMLWLGATHGFHKFTKLLNQCDMYHGRSWRKLKPHSRDSYTSDCVYVKTHVPWVDKSLEDERLWSADRAAVILRHPYDSALANYKRQVVLKKSGNINKQRTDGLTKSLFLDDQLNLKNGTEWLAYRRCYIERWLHHAKFWLSNWATAKPLKIIIYKDFMADTARQLDLQLQFFGYVFDKPNMHRHCCVLNNPFSKYIKRGKSEIDDYKEVIYEKDEEFRSLCEEAVSEAQSLLDTHWPGVYTIKRG